jgi:hypothetical protein
MIIFSNMVSLTRGSNRGQDTLDYTQGTRSNSAALWYSSGESTSSSSSISSSASSSSSSSSVVEKERKGETPVGPILDTSRKCTQAGWVSEVCVGACAHILQ